MLNILSSFTYIKIAALRRKTRFGFELIGLKLQHLLSSLKIWVDLNTLNQKQGIEDKKRRKFQISLCFSRSSKMSFGIGLWYNYIWCMTTDEWDEMWIFLKNKWMSFFSLNLSQLVKNKFVWFMTANQELSCATWFWGMKIAAEVLKNLKRKETENSFKTV